MLEIIFSISPCNVVYAGVWDQSKRDTYFLRVFTASFFASSEVEVVAENNHQKHESQMWMGPFLPKMKLQEHAAWANYWNPVGVSSWFWERFLPMKFERPWAWCSLLPIDRFSNCRNLLYFLARKQVVWNNFLLWKHLNKNLKYNLFHCGARANWPL